MTGVTTLTVAVGGRGRKPARPLAEEALSRDHPGPGGKACRTGQIKGDGGRVKASTRVSPGQQVRVPPLPRAAAATAPKPEAGISEADARMIQAAVLWKDEHIIALNKPPGLPSQGGSGRAGAMSTG